MFNARFVFVTSNFNFEIRIVCANSPARQMRNQIVNFAGATRIRDLTANFQGGIRIRKTDS